MHIASAILKNAKSKIKEKNLSLIKINYLIIFF